MVVCGVCVRQCCFVRRRLLFHSRCGDYFVRLADIVLILKDKYISGKPNMTCCVNLINIKGVLDSCTHAYFMSSLMNA